VNGDTAILIEDKTDTEDHSDKLLRYVEAVADEFPRDRIAAVYLKTGDQCSYESAKQAGYGCFLRRDFLDVLDRGEALGVKNDTFTDFHRYLRGIEEEVRSFPAFPPENWSPRQWVGFFMAVREKLGDGEWAVRAGGSLTFRWNQRDGRDGKYLRLHEDKDELAFCIAVTEKSHQKEERDKWYETLKGKGGTGGVNVSSAPRKLGRRMTVAVLDGDYRHRDGRGLLDLNRTVETLRKATAFMDAALGASSAT
jgi:hypothetical protein